jgi:hypothetical protein
MGMLSVSKDSLRQSGRRVATTLALAVGGVFAVPDAAGAETLFDHTPSVIGFHPTIQDFETTFDDDDSFAADDFTVPAGETWTPQRVLVDGRKPTDAGPGTTSTVNFALYATQGTLPGGPALYSMQLTADAGTPYPDFDLALPSAPALGPGTYWLEAQPVMDFGAEMNYWFWGTAPDQRGNPAVYRNPGGGFNSDCMSFGLLTDCVAGVTNPDLAFRVEGTRVVAPATGGPPPAPVAAPKKKKCKKAKKKRSAVAAKKCRKKK